MKKLICYLAVFLSLLIVPKLSLAEESTSGAIIEAEVEGIGWVTEVEGRVKLIPATGGEDIVLAEGIEIFLNDEISTSTNASAMIELNDGSVIALAPLSRIKATSFIYDEEAKKNKSYLKLFAGSVRGLLKDLFGTSSKMSFETDTSVVGVKGSDISVWFEDGDTVVAVNEGRGFIKSMDRKFPGSASIKAGFMARGSDGTAVKRAVAIPDNIKTKINKLKVKRKKSLVNKFKKKKEKERKNRGAARPEKKVEEKPKENKPKQGVKSGEKPKFIGKRQP